LFTLINRIATFVNSSSHLGTSINSQGSILVDHIPSFFFDQ
jgi:hypothetical protein